MYVRTSVCSLHGHRENNCLMTEVGGWATTAETDPLTCSINELAPCCAIDPSHCGQCVSVTVFSVCLSLYMSCDKAAVWLLGQSKWFLCCRGSPDPLTMHLSLRTPLWALWGDVRKVQAYLNVKWNASKLCPVDECTMLQCHVVLWITHFVMC